jgi:hypothetical protein
MVAKAAKLEECSNTNFIIERIFSFEDKSFRNKHVITKACGNLILTPYFAPPIKAEAMAVSSSRRKDDEDDDDDDDITVSS